MIPRELLSAPVMKTNIPAKAFMKKETEFATMMIVSSFMIPYAVQSASPKKSTGSISNWFPLHRVRG
jgi:hypothetical protein